MCLPLIHLQVKRPCLQYNVQNKGSFLSVISSSNLIGWHTMCENKKTYRKVALFRHKCMILYWCISLHMVKPDVGHKKKKNMAMAADVGGPLAIFCDFIESV